VVLARKSSTSKQSMSLTAMRPFFWKKNEDDENDPGESFKHSDAKEVPSFKLDEVTMIKCIGRFVELFLPFIRCVHLPNFFSIAVKFCCLSLARVNFTKL